MSIVRHPAYLLACLVVLAAPAAKAQSGPRWSGLTVVPVQNDTPSSRTVFTRNLSVLFDSMRASLQGSGAPLVMARTIAIRASIDGTDGRSIRLSQHLRGFVNKPANARVVILVEAGGVARTLVYPYGVPHTGDVTVSLPATTRWPAGRPWAAVITLVVERGSTSVPVLAGVESLDATVDAGAVPAR